MTTRKEFCTILDVNFLTRGLVLYRSLVDTCEAFHLTVFCADERSYSLLERLALPQLEAVPFAELEADDPELLAVKPTRTLNEYCWTAKPAACLSLLRREPRREQVTFLDADLMFWSDPAPLFAELGEDSVLLVPQRTRTHREGAPRIDLGPSRFNSGFVTFCGDDRGLAALVWWRDRCLEWCYDRVEDGKWGDQTYLNELPEHFPGVRVLRHLGAIFAPWNTGSYELEQHGDELSVEGQRLVLYHYQSLRLLRSRDGLRRLSSDSGRFHFVPHPIPLVWTAYAGYRFSQLEVVAVWQPYVERVGVALDDVRALDPSFRAGLIRDDAVGQALEWLRQILPDRLKKRTLAIDRAVRGTLSGGSARPRSRHFFT